MIIMNNKKRKDLDEAIRAHAQAMYDWGITQDNTDLDKVKTAWDLLNKVIDGDRDEEAKKA